MGMPCLVVSFAVDTLVFGYRAFCCGVVFFTAFTTLFFPFAERSSVPKAVTFITLVQVPLGCVTFDFVFCAVDDEATLDPLIGGVLIFGVDLDRTVRH
jgi:hypothetical protein